MLLVLALLGTTKGAVKSGPTWACRKLAGTKPSDSGPSYVPRLLIGIVAESSNATINRALNNVRALAHHRNISLVIAVIDNQLEKWKNVIKEARNRKVQLSVDDANPSGERCPYCPKLQFQLQFAARTTDVDYVWLPDSDMSFNRFDMRKFWRYHRRAGSPLISQPTVRQGTQHLGFRVTHSLWHPCAAAQNFVRMTYIEQQTPVFDASFFRWLAPKFKDLAARQVTLQGSWGHDFIWCGAARIYQQGSFHDSRRRPECTLILVPQDHDNSKTMGTKDSGFYERSFMLVTEITHRGYCPRQHPVNKMADATADLCKLAVSEPRDPWFIHNSPWPGCSNSSNNFGHERLRAHIYKQARTAPLTPARCPHSAADPGHRG